MAHVPIGAGALDGQKVIARTQVDVADDGVLQATWISGRDECAAAVVQFEYHVQIRVHCGVVGPQRCRAKSGREREVVDVGHRSDNAGRGELGPVVRRRQRRGGADRVTVIVIPVAESVGTARDHRHVVLVRIVGELTCAVVPRSRGGRITVAHDRGPRAVARVVFLDLGRAAVDALVVQTEGMSRFVRSGLTDVLGVAVAQGVLKDVNNI